MTKCMYCNTTLKKIKYDWDTRCLHIKCYKKITNGMQALDLYFDDNKEYRNTMIEKLAQKCNVSVNQLFKMLR